MDKPDALTHEVDSASACPQYLGAIDLTFARRRYEIVVLIHNQCNTMYSVYKEAQATPDVT